MYGYQIIIYHVKNLVDQSTPLAFLNEMFRNWGSDACLLLLYFRLYIDINIYVFPLVQVFDVKSEDSKETSKP